jgi:hypothetical protein
VEEDLEGRVSRQFSGLYLTLVSVMVGLVLSDLIGQIHDRMTLWPLTWQTARTWLQISGTGLAVLSSWVSYTHLGMLRNRLPTIWDTLDASLVLVTIPLNAAVGRADPSAWFFWAAAFSVLGLTAIRINVWQATREPALAHLPRIARFGGPYTFLYLGVPGFALTGVLCRLGWAPPWFQLGASLMPTIGAAVVTITFMREWRAAVRHRPS